MDEQTRITRRRFLMLTGGAVGASALACGGLATLGLRQPRRSTGEVAEAIGQVLCEAGAAVDVRLAKEVTDLSPYRAVVVGSAVYMGKWMPEAVKFVETHRDALSRMPVAYFLI